MSSVHRASLALTLTALVRVVVTVMALFAIGVVSGNPSLGAGSAWAKDGADDGGSHDSGDDHGGGHDSSGSDDGGSHGSGQGRDSGNGGSGHEGASDDNHGSSLDLYYSDGFHEQVVDGIYRLTDKHGRVVISRRAVTEDVKRIQRLSP